MNGREQAGPATPDRRPTWMMVLSSLMLISAFHLLLAGVSALRDGPMPVPGPSPGPSVEAPEVMIQRSLAAAMSRVHPVAVRVHGASRVAVALVWLFAVAAILTNDRRGRVATLAAASLGIVYHLGSTAFFMVLVRAGVREEAPRLAEALTALQPGAPPTTPHEVVAMAESLVLVSALVLAAAGIGFCVLLLVYFGGRRGRAFYGALAAAPAPSARL